jgi:cytochrome c oxidase subunit 2
VQADTTYHFELTSKDVVHSFSIPVFRLKQDAVPGRVITGWFRPTTPGTYDIQCAEICGIGHALMPATLTIETPDRHQEWMRSKRA